MSGFEMTEEEMTVSEILLGLHTLFSSPAAEAEPAVVLPRWGKKRKRSVPIEDNIIHSEIVVAKGDERSSPATPLAFYPSGGDDTDPFPPPQQPPKKIFRKMAHHKQWVDEQTRRIDSLSSTRTDLQRSVEEARWRYRMLAERNCWLKHHLQQKMMNEMMIRQQQQQQQKQKQKQRALDLFSVGPNQQQQRWQAAPLDLNRSAAATAADEVMLARQQRLLVSAQARKRRKALQRAKSSSTSSASANDKVPRLR